MVLAALALPTIAAWLIDRRVIFRRSSTPTLTMQQARAFNARVSFVTSRRQPAAPYRYRGTLAAREQAVQCLATAALYEAGSDERDQKAVIQVILNRFRLPQYPRTICGVVYQVATLPTGCQFSFACDGSQTRRPETRGWESAHHLAARAPAQPSLPPKSMI